MPVWVTYQLAGAAVAAELHEVARRTVYRLVDATERNAALLLRAKQELERRRAEDDARAKDLRAAAQEALIARVRAGKLHAKYLVQLAGVAQPTSSKTKAALEVPAYLTAPRVDTNEEP